MKNQLILKPLSTKDIDSIMLWVNDPEVIKNFQNFKKRITRSEELSFVKKLIASKNDRTFSIFEKNTKEYIGQISINQISWQNKLGRLSVFISRQHWGRGYGQEAIPLILKIAFKELKLNKIWLIVYAENKKGLHLYKKIGFKKEGLLKEEYFWEETYHDMVRMALLKSGFKS